MKLIQIGEQKTAKGFTIQQMFEQMAQREAQMIREARERVSKQSRTNS
jgi:hypothetical protein